MADKECARNRQWRRCVQWEKSRYNDGVRRYAKAKPPLPDGIAQLTNRALRLATAVSADVNNNNVHPSRSASLRTGKRWKQGGSNIRTRRRRASCVCVRKCVKCVLENNISSRPAGPSSPHTMTRRGTTPWQRRVRECLSVLYTLQSTSLMFWCCYYCCLLTLSFKNNGRRHVNHSESRFVVALSSFDNLPPLHIL